MKLLTTYLTIVSSLSLATASSCTSDVALAWPYTPEDSNSNTDNNSDNSSTCAGEEHCSSIAASGQCNSLNLIDDSDSTCAEKLRLLKRAVKLDCASGETCFAYVDGSLLCLDSVSGEYHDDVGGEGNALSGVYTAPSGEVQTITGVSAEPSSTAPASKYDEAASGSTTSARASQTEFETAAAATAAESSSVSGSPTQDAAAAQETGGTDRLGASLVSGLLVVAGLQAIISWCM